MIPGTRLVNEINAWLLLFVCFIDIVAFKEELYELIDDVDAPPKKEQSQETEVTTDKEKGEERQKDDIK